MTGTSSRSRWGALASEGPYVSYLEGLRQRGQSENTLRCASFAFAHLDAFMHAGGQELRDVTPADLDGFRQSLIDRGLACTTVDVISRQVRRLFRWLAQSGRIFLDPAALWPLPRPERRLWDVLTEEQIAMLLAQPDLTRPRGIRDRAWIETAYSTGARLGELEGLVIHDLDLDYGLLRVMGKGRKERMLPLGKQAVAWLRRYVVGARPELVGGKLGETKLWLRPDGRPISGPGMGVMLRQHARAAGLPPVSPHALRRACATHMLRNGAHPVQIQLLLGHADLTSLSQYLHLTIRDIRAMHARSKVGR